MSLRNVYETLAISAPTMLDAFRGTVSREICDERLESWASKVVANLELMVSVNGREHVDPNTTYLIMSNHQSHYDVAVIYYVLGASIRMVAKRELFEVPVFGRAMQAAGFVSVDRQNRERAVASLENVKAKLKSGVPMWIAPEGTRSPTGELMPFKKGGFVLALETGAPILPVTLRGTRDALRAKGLRSKPGADVFVTIHPPIASKPYAALEPKAARDALSDAVRTAIASGL